MCLFKIRCGFHAILHETSCKKSQRYKLILTCTKKSTTDNTICHDNGNKTIHCVYSFGVLIWGNMTLQQY